MQKSKTRAGEPKQDSYMNMVRRFPLKTIKNDRDHARAIEVVEELMGTNLDGGSGDYLDALLVLVTKYEDEHHAIDPSMSPQQALRALMEFNDLNQADIGKIIGSESAVSMFLSGSRGLSQTQIKRLCERFKVDAMAFMG